LTTKLHAPINRLEKPFDACTVPAMPPDLALAGPLLAGLGVEKLVADKAYDSRALIEMTHGHEAH